MSNLHLSDCYRIDQECGCPTYSSGLVWKRDVPSVCQVITREGAELFFLIRINTVGSSLSGEPAGLVGMIKHFPSVTCAGFTSDVGQVMACTTLPCTLYTRGPAAALCVCVLTAPVLILYETKAKNVLFLSLKFLFSSLFDLHFSVCLTWGQHLFFALVWYFERNFLQHSKLFL